MCTSLRVFRVTPTLFDGEYVWQTKYDSSQSNIVLLHFEWAFFMFNGVITPMNLSRLFVHHVCTKPNNVSKACFKIMTFSV